MRVPLLVRVALEIIDHQGGGEAPEGSGLGRSAQTQLIHTPEVVRQALQGRGLIGGLCRGQDAFVRVRSALADRVGIGAEVHMVLGGSGAGHPGQRGSQARRCCPCRRGWDSRPSAPGRRSSRRRLVDGRAVFFDLIDPPVVGGAGGQAGDVVVHHHHLARGRRDWPRSDSDRCPDRRCAGWRFRPWTTAAKERPRRRSHRPGRASPPSRMRAQMPCARSAIWLALNSRS